MHDGSCLATFGRVVRYGIRPHLHDWTKPIHVDVSVILQLLGKLRCQDLVKVGGKVTQGIAHCQLWFGYKKLILNCRKKIIIFNQGLIDWGVCKPLILVQCNLNYPDLVYPDLLETSKYISTHVQRAWPMIY